MAELQAARDWESAALVAAALEAGPQRRLLLTLGAGDTALGLSLTGAQVIAAAAHGADRALWELKAAGTSLERLEHLQLFGLESAGRRVFLYHRVRASLSPDARAFWDAHEEEIRTGVLSMGGVERRLTQLRQAVPLAHRRSTAMALLATQGAARERFVRQRWEGPRWRAWLALAARELGGAARPPVGWLVARLHEVLVRGPQPNGFLEHALTGAPVSASALPPCLHPAGHGQLGRASEVRLEEAPLTEVAARGGLDGIHLGNGPVPDGVAGALRPGGLLTRWLLPGTSDVVPGLVLETRDFAPQADPVGVRGTLARWRR